MSEDKIYDVIIIGAGSGRYDCRSLCVTGEYEHAHD